MSRTLKCLAPLLFACTAGSALAADAAAGAAPYPGTLLLHVDLSDTPHRVFHVREFVPAAPGPIELLYPQWIPGEHSPSGTLDGVSGLVITANGLPVPWRRDLDDMFRLHVDVPAGAKGLDLAFEFLSPGPGRKFGGSVSATPALTVLEWNQVVFYPAGVPVRQVTIAPAVTVPADWRWATALEAAPAADADAGKAPAGGVHFAPVSLEALVDSPLATGRYFRQIPLSDSPVPVRLDLFADRAENLAASDEQIRHQQRLVKEAAALFGARHYRHYDFLFVLSDLTGHFGLEHHESSDDRLGADYFTDPDYYLAGSDLLPHEYTHSWNGKYRRPAGLLTPDYNVPMKGELLWVYEGLTTYWGEVLSARSGARTPEQFRDLIATLAAAMEYTPGRAWRPLQDTADEAQILYGMPQAWSRWRRGVDFYPEGALVWLDADTLIREASHGERSLDDFARTFYGQDDGQATPRPYTFDDVVAALDKVQHYDWARFLRARLDGKSALAPLDGIVRGGWKLVYTDEASAMSRAQAKVRKSMDLASSLGIVVDTGEASGTLADVVWKSPAFEAGLAPGMRLVAVNGTRFTPEILRDAIKAARTGTQPTELLVQDFDQFRAVKIDYHGGLRYPHLVRIENTDERLDDIVRSRAR
jgi:predicted metalloprotease with PDZ domain